jgi:hypothetical protein
MPRRIFKFKVENGASIAFSLLRNRLIGSPLWNQPEKDATVSISKSTLKMLDINVLGLQCT